MKKLRRSLALVMAIVMLSGMFAFGGPAAVAEDVLYEDYADQASINEDYEGAIELFSMMKVIEGDAGTRNFRPDGNLQRREAAAIITRTLISAEQALQLDNARSAFGDVAAGQWFTGPIAFAQNRGLIAGIGNNMFAPEATLTKVQWVRILLSALGWGQNAEFEGVGWESRVMETATSAALDLFGQHRIERRWTTMFCNWPTSHEPDGLGNPDEHYHDPDWPDEPCSHHDRLSVPNINSHLPITREEAVALLYNAVLNVPKVNWTLLNGYTTQSATRGLGGTAYRYIANDIGLDYEYGGIERDLYGRPVRLNDELWYRGNKIQDIPGELPGRFAEERITPNMTGTELRLLLQGIPEVDRLLLTGKISIFVNGREQFARDVALEDYYQRIGTATDLLLPLIAAKGDPLRDANPLKYETLDESLITSGYVEPWTVLDAYLTGVGGDTAFGPSVALEIYRYDNDYLDIVIIDTYLAQYRERRLDDTRTPLVDESRVVFHLFRGPGSTPTTGIQSVAFDDDFEDNGWSPIGIDNWDSFYDNPSNIGNYYLATPKARILPVGGVTALPYHPSENNNDNLLTEVFEASTTITGVAGLHSVTRLQVAASTYDLGLNRPTVNRFDNTHNYTYYLDENDVIIGAVYTSAGQPSMSSMLYLHSTLGRGAATATEIILPENQRAIAQASLTTGAGLRSAQAGLPFNARGATPTDAPPDELLGSYVAPDNVVRNLPAYDPGDTDLYGATPLDGYDPTWFNFTVTGSGTNLTYTLLPVKVKPVASGSDPYTGVGSPYPDANDANSNYVALSGSNISIQQGQLTISTDFTSAVATDRTVLTVITGMSGTGRLVRVGVDRFPDIDPAAGAEENAARALVLLEPGDATRIAEILYINQYALNIDTSTTYYAYLMADPMRNQSTGTATASFLVNESSPIRENLVINRQTSDAVSLNAVSRFYKLVQDDNGEWTATVLPYSNTGDNSVRTGFLSGTITSSQFGLARTYQGPNPATIAYSPTLRMPVVSVITDAGDDGGLGVGRYLGDNQSIAGATDKAVAVVIVGNVAVAAFVFNIWADGLPPLQ